MHSDVVQYTNKCQPNTRVLKQLTKIQEVFSMTATQRQ